MTLLIPILLCFATLAVAYWRRRPIRVPAAEIQERDTQADTESIQQALTALRERRETVRQKLLASGEVIEFANVNVICEKGHQHGLNRFTRANSENLVEWHPIDARNLINYDHTGVYNGPNLFGREPGVGLGWIKPSFGCPTCSAQRFSFSKFDLNEYTTCGYHLVRKDYEECPLCAELRKAAIEEVKLLAELESSQFPQRKAS